MPELGDKPGPVARTPRYRFPAPGALGSVRLAMQPSEIFRFCPRCGARRSTTESPFRCGDCGFLYYFNPCCAVGGLIRNASGAVLMLRRAKEPARGKLAVPGGFIDLGETAEDALRRETREEVDLELGELTYLCSRTNAYHYQEITYPVLDLFFVATALDPAKARPLDGVDSLEWLSPSGIDLGEIAFPSIRSAVSLFINQVSSRP